MTQKRRIQEAFGPPKGQLSAYAAAKKAAKKIVVQASEVLSNVALDDAEEAYEETNAGTGIIEPADPKDDASDLENEPISTASIATPTTPVVKLSSWIPRKGRLLRDDAHMVEMKFRNDETATFVGEYDLTVVKGAVSFHGAVLQPSHGTQRIHAPSTHALPAIVARVDDTLIRVSSVDRPVLEILGNLSPLFRNVGAGGDDKSRSFQFLSTTADDPLRRSLSSLEVDETTKKALSRISVRLETDKRTPSRIMAVGPKSSGKSTLNRLICNMILSRGLRPKCLFLDIDPGQPEFGPPGQLSLVEVCTPILGPPYLHPASATSPRYRLIRSHALAATSFRDDADHYTACALDLLRRVPDDAPLIVNTCGWVTGLGASVLTTLSKRLSLTEAIVIDRVDDALLQALSSNNRVDCSIQRLPRRPARPSPRSPAELRAMQTMAYFHHRTPSRNPHNAPTYTKKPLSLLRPWIVSYASANPGVRGVLSYGQAPHPEFLCEALDGTVVAIVLVEDTSVLDDNYSTSYTPYESLPYITSSSAATTTNPHNSILQPLDPRATRTLGLALIRSIDPASQTLHLLTPLSDAQILAATTIPSHLSSPTQPSTTAPSPPHIILVRGAFDPPTWAYLEDIHAASPSTTTTATTTTALIDAVFAADHLSDDLPARVAQAHARPWISYSTEMVGVEGAVWRLRHPPLPGQGQGR